jgi:hypothetical protein
VIGSGSTQLRYIVTTVIPASAGATVSRKSPPVRQTTKKRRERALRFFIECD